jgi:hypothetical protein
MPAGVAEAVSAGAVACSILVLVGCCWENTGNYRSGLPELKVRRFIFRDVVHAIMPSFARLPVQEPVPGIT